MTQKRTQKATLGMGCFWCSTAVYEQLDGILSVTSGFSGGHVENPTYEQVCTGETGHAEVAHIEFDSTRISYEDILYVFWRIHDPTTLNKQDHDVGTEYRSIILYHDQKQKLIAKQSKVDAQSLYTNPIVTEIQPFTQFSQADKHHQNFYRNNASLAYCKIVIDPKIEKLKKILTIMEK